MYLHIYLTTFKCINSCLHDASIWITGLKIAVAALGTGWM